MRILLGKIVESAGDTLDKMANVWYVISFTDQFRNNFRLLFDESFWALCITVCNNMQTQNNLVVWS